LPRPRELPERARVVIVGGGVGGTSIAYHLAQLGERDVVLVDRAELTSGSTFHSAGLVGQLRGSVSLTRMMMDSVALYRRLGEACGWVECGGLRLACTPEREEELHRELDSLFNEQNVSSSLEVTSIPATFLRVSVVV